MNPSKENAQAAIEKLAQLLSQHAEGEDRKFIREFLEAAQRKLPSEETLLRDKLRKRVPPKETKL